MTRTKEEEILLSPWLLCTTFLLLATTHSLCIADCYGGLSVVAYAAFLSKKPWVV